MRIYVYIYIYKYIAISICIHVYIYIHIIYIGTAAVGLFRSLDVCGKLLKVSSFRHAEELRQTTNATHFIVLFCIV